MKLGKQCKWDDIEVGEVFVVEGCVNILYKMDNKKALYLANDFEISDDREIGLIHHLTKDFWKEYRYLETKNKDFSFNIDTIYKLPKATQAHWKVE